LDLPSEAPCGRRSLEIVTGQKDYRPSGGHCHIYRIYCLLLASVAGPVLMKSTTQRFSLRPQNRLYLLNVTKPPPARKRMRRRMAASLPFSGSYWMPAVAYILLGVGVTVRGIRRCAGDRFGACRRDVPPAGII
jgi:hypothetical protein